MPGPLSQTVARTRSPSRSVTTPTRGSRLPASACAALTSRFRNTCPSPASSPQHGDVARQRALHLHSLQLPRRHAQGEPHRGVEIDGHAHRLVAAQHALHVLHHAADALRALQRVDGALAQLVRLRPMCSTFSAMYWRLAMMKLV